jgi:hypothetical protein
MRLETEKQMMDEKAAFNVEFLKFMQKLDVRDGDVVVINCSIPCEQMKILREYVNEFLDYMAVDAKIMFLPEGAEIGVLRKGDKGEINNERHTNRLESNLRISQGKREDGDTVQKAKGTTCYQRSRWTPCHQETICR